MVQCRRRRHHVAHAHAKKSKTCCENEFSDLMNRTASPLFIIGARIHALIELDNIAASLEFFLRKVSESSCKKSISSCPKAK